MILNLFHKGFDRIDTFNVGIIHSYIIILGILILEVVIAPHYQQHTKYLQFDWLMNT